MQSNEWSLLWYQIKTEKHTRSVSFVMLKFGKKITVVQILKLTCVNVFLDIFCLHGQIRVKLCEYYRIWWLIRGDWVKIGGIYYPQVCKWSQCMGGIDSECLGICKWFFSQASKNRKITPQHNFNMLNNVRILWKRNHLNGTSCHRISSFVGLIEVEIAKFHCRLFSGPKWQNPKKTWFSIRSFLMQNLLPRVC